MFMTIMQNATDVKKGQVLRLENELYAVTYAQFVNPGKGSAFIRTKLKHIPRGTVIEKTFKSAEKVEDIDLEKRYMQFLYRDGEQIVFMDKDDFEQFSIPLEMVEDLLPYMKEEMQVQVNFYEGNPVSLTPPTFVELKVTYSEQGVRGDTVGNARKKVQVETGAEVQVPLYIQQDDIIKIDLRDFNFVERINNK